MKKFVFSTCVAFFLLLYYSCTKDMTKPATPPDCVGVNTSTNTYSLNIKGIMDSYCAIGGCHDAASAQFGVDLSSYSTTVSAFKTKNVICSVKQEGCIPMPQTGRKLADSLIIDMQCWSANGYPQ